MISKRDESIIKLFTLFCKFFKNPSYSYLEEIKKEINKIKDEQIKNMELLYGFLLKS